MRHITITKNDTFSTFTAGLKASVGVVICRVTRELAAPNSSWSLLRRPGSLPANMQSVFGPLQAAHAMGLRHYRLGMSWLDGGRPDMKPDSGAAARIF